MLLKMSLFSVETSIGVDVSCAINVEADSMDI